MISERKVWREWAAKLTQMPKVNERLRVWAPIVLLSLGVLLFFHKMVFSNLILARGDTFLYFYPYWEASAEALRSGRVPLWNPSLFMGAPFLANSQAGFFYPLNWPLWWFLPTPYAVSASIILHLVIAGLGTYVLARRRTGMGQAAAFLAGILFCLGGYLTAQVEHVNQLQGLAWLPWLLAVVQSRSKDHDWPGILRKALFIGALFALQLLAGHTQTTFISGVAVLVWVLAEIIGQRLIAKQENNVTGGNGRVYFLPALLPLIAGVGLALLLTAVQILPTMELVRHSSRQGGLPLDEAVSFSLHPLLLAQALLPHYGQSLFTEYVSFLPLTALVLAFVGAWQWRRRAALIAPLLLAVTGLMFALGRFNPLYILLAHLPGFSFFRAPARWQILYALGVALLAAHGWRVVLGTAQRNAGKNESSDLLSRPLKMAVVIILLLMGWNVLSVPLATIIPTGAEAPAEFPSLLTALLWLVELPLAALLLSRPNSSMRNAPVLLALPLVLILVFLFGATRGLPYNNLTTPAAYFDLRPPIARLQALSNCDLLPAQCQEPSGRVLSLSDIFFDPGDEAEMRTIYGDQLSADALYDYIVAVKQKEVIAPNLPMAFGLTSVDGFDGGILPLRHYAQLVQLLLPADADPVDGRLREYLDRVPDPRWLDLFNARYLITDKVGDVWHQGVFFDRQHPVELEPGQTATVRYLPEYEATAIWFIAEGAPGQVLVEAASGERWRLEPEQIEGALWQATFPEPTAPRAVQFEAMVARWSLQGSALVDSRDESFQPLIVGAYRLIHSGDVKLYENLDVLPRAFLVHEWQWEPDVVAAVSAMTDDAFDPATRAILVGQGESGDLQADDEKVTIERYEAEQVVITLEATASGVLILTDANYPGWRATLNGQETPVYQANGLFRAIMVPEGEHEVVFIFTSKPFLVGRAISIIGLVLWGALFILISFYRHRILLRS